MRDRIFAAVATTPLRTAADLRNFGGLAVQIERLIEDAKKPTSMTEPRNPSPMRHGGSGLRY